MNYKEYIEINSFNIDVNNVNSSIRELMRSNIDFDVYLPSVDMNLQREFVWSVEQCRELIKSILIDRHIPPITILMTLDESLNDVYQIIDGKQRLMAIKKFWNDEYDFEIDGKKYFYSELPEDFRSHFIHKYLTINRCLDPFNKKHRMSDSKKIEWFTFINCSGTEQDMKHIKELDNRRNNHE